MGQNTDPGRADSGFVHYAQSSLDRIVSPASRPAAYDTTTSFAVARPILFVRSTLPTLPSLITLSSVD